MSSSKKTSDGEARVEKETDERERSCRTSSNRSAPKRDNLLRTSSREDTSTDARDYSNSPRQLSANSLLRPLTQRISATALVPVPTFQRRHNTHRRVSIQNQPDVVNLQNSSASTRNSGYRGFRSTATSEFVVFSCVTNRPFSVHLTSQGISMNPSNSQPGFNMGRQQDVPNGNVPHDRRQTEPMGSQQLQRIQGDQAAPSISHHHGTSFNFYFVNSGNYGLNFSGNALPTPVQQQQAPPPAYQGYNGVGQPGMFGSNPFPAPRTENNSLMVNRGSSSSAYSSYHQHPFPSSGFQQGCAHPHHQQFAQGQTPLAIQQQGPSHYPSNTGGNLGPFRPIPNPDSVFSEHRAPNTSFNASRTLSQSSLGDGSLYGDENDHENASQHSQSSHCPAGGMFGPCSIHGFHK
ncbi:unnamed protein product [Orchesella dallaii]|uniref:Uncharacterized protein n=1 Tax=Orchesella dallaii TaxID=48710 RepID=A0ABP1QKA8_9HEXA